MTDKDGDFAKGKHRSLIYRGFVNQGTILFIIVLTIVVTIFQLNLLKSDLSAQLIVLIPVTLFYSFQGIYQSVLDLKSTIFYKKNRDILIPANKTRHYPSVAFVIPSYQEPYEVAKLTLDNIVSLKYKGSKEIVVVDNSKNTSSNDYVNWKSYVLEKKDEGINIKFLYNHQSEGLKPGNLDLAHENIIDSEFVVFLDVDSTLPIEKSLIEKSVLEFETDPKLGYLQYNIVATNNHFNHLTQSIGVSQNLLRYRNNLKGYGGFTVFSGHNGMWRKDVLDKTGPWLQYYRNNVMVTEDILKSVHCYTNDYYGKSLSIETGEWIPASLDALEKMWMRWTYGTCQVLWKHWKDFVFSKKMKTTEKVDLLHFIVVYLSGCTSLITATMLSLFSTVQFSNSMLLISLFLGYFSGGVLVYKKHYYKNENISMLKKIGYIYSGLVFVNTFICITQLKAFINFLMRKPQGWVSTCKNIEKGVSWYGSFKQRKFHYFVHASILVLTMFTFYFKYKLDPSKLYYFGPMLFIIINSIFGLIFFQNDGRKKNNLSKTASIEYATKESA